MSFRCRSQSAATSMTAMTTTMSGGRTTLAILEVRPAPTGRVCPSGRSGARTPLPRAGSAGGLRRRGRLAPTRDRHRKSDLAAVLLLQLGPGVVECGQLVHQGLAAELAHEGVRGDVLAAVRALLGAECASPANTQEHDELDDQEENGREHQEVDDVGEERAVLYSRIVDLEVKRAEVLLAEDRGDELHQHVVGERLDQSGELGSDDEAEGQIQHVATYGEAFELVPQPAHGRQPAMPRAPDGIP